MLYTITTSLPLLIAAAFLSNGINAFTPQMRFLARKRGTLSHELPHQSGSAALSQLRKPGTTPAVSLNMVECEMAASSIVISSAIWDAQSVLLWTALCGAAFSLYANVQRSEELKEGVKVVNKNAKDDEVDSSVAKVRRDLAAARRPTPFGTTAATTETIDSTPALWLKEPTGVATTETKVLPEPTVVTTTETKVLPEPTVVAITETIVQPKPTVVASPEETVEPKQAVITATEEDLIQLKKEVATTVEEVQETSKRLATKEIKKAVAVQSEKVAEEVKKPPLLTVTNEPAKKTTGRKRRLAAKVIKKVLMPWKAWKSL